MMKAADPEVNYSAAQYPLASAPPLAASINDLAQADSGYDAFLDFLSSTPLQPRPDTTDTSVLPRAGLPVQATDDATVHYEDGAWTVIPAADKTKRRSWAKASGRTHGKEGYKFGDVTRTFVGALLGKGDRGWKEKTGRSGGKDGYKLGDFTRVAVSNLFGDKHREGGGEGSGMGAMPRPEPLLGSAAELRGAGTRGSLLDGVWVGFFNSAYAVGRLALLAGELAVGAVEDSEPSVMIGLPALALLECAIRSAAAAAGEGGRLVAFDGARVGRAALVSARAVDAASLAVFDDMVRLARRVGGCRLSPAGLASLRARALAVDGTAGAALAPAEDAEVNGMVAASQSVATRLSQTSLYKHGFERVLRALGEERRHEADMIKMVKYL